MSAHKQILFRFKSSLNASERGWRAKQVCLCVSMLFLYIGFFLSMSRRNKKQGNVNFEQPFFINASTENNKQDSKFEALF